MRALCDNWQAMAAADPNSLPFRACQCLHARLQRVTTHVVAKNAMRQRAREEWRRHTTTGRRS